MTFISPMREMSTRKHDDAWFGQFAPSLPMAHQVRRVIEQLIHQTYGRQRPIAIYLGSHEYYTLRDQDPLSLDMRDGGLLFDGVPVYPVALPSHLRVYGAPR